MQRIAVTGRLLKMIWRIHHTLRPRLVALIERQPADKQIIHIRSPQELQRFIAKVCAPG